MLNKQVSNYVVLPFFSNNANIVTFVLTGYGFTVDLENFGVKNFIRLKLLRN